MTDLPEVICPGCDARFTVIWTRRYEGDEPEFCPMCGDEMDYEECRERANDETD